MYILYSKVLESCEFACTVTLSLPRATEESLKISSDETISLHDLRTITTLSFPGFRVVRATANPERLARVRQICTSILPKPPK